MQKSSSLARQAPQSSSQTSSWYGRRAAPVHLMQGNTTQSSVEMVPIVLYLLFLPWILHQYIILSTTEIESRNESRTRHPFFITAQEISSELHQPNSLTQMAGDKKESGPKRWLKSAKSAFKDHGRSSSSPSEAKTCGASSATSAASGSVASLPSRSDSNSLAPTVESAIISGAATIIPEQLLRLPQEQTTTPDSAANPLDNRVAQPSVHAAVGEKATLPGGKFLRAL